MTESPYPLVSFETDGGQFWPAQGEWTYEDYLRLPDDGRRYEVLRGVLYRVPTRRFEHQVAITGLFRTIGRFVEDLDLGVCLTAFDVVLGEIATPVQPDFLFLRKGREPRPDACCFEGSPDLIVEVLAPETARYDRELKFAIYEEAGVPEYWLVDPMEQTLVNYGLDASGRFVELDCESEFGTVRSLGIEDLRLQAADLLRCPD
jgi:Uma2 family endonuclease